MKKNIVILILSFVFASKLYSQSPSIPYDNDYYNKIHNLEVESGGFTNYFHSSVNPITRLDLSNFLRDSVFSSKLGNDKRVKYLLSDNVLFDENTKLKPKNRTFYKFENSMFHFKDTLYVLSINPILNIGIGEDFQNHQKTSYNTRGLEVYGSIYRKISFYSYLTDNIVLPLNFVNDYVKKNGVYPTASLTKGLGNGAYNFLQARGYISINPIKPIFLQFGHDRNFIGDGYRSFIMSDFGKEFLFGKLNFHAHKINYLFLGGQMINNSRRSERDFTFDKKYIAYHQLSINATKRLNFSFFETVVFSRTDTNGNNSGFDFSYANPVIFYRSVEHGLNSSDNAMLGLTYKFIPAKSVLVYGQFVLDEFKLDELIARKGWYANKYAIQTGIKWIKPLKIENLWLQGEYNLVRPYTFMHFKKSQSFVHYNSPVGHPLGANFKEVILTANYYLGQKISINMTLIKYLKGLDKDTMNWGGDIVNKVYTTAVSLYGNKIGQGMATNVTVFDLVISYSVYHNLYIDLNYINRNSNSQLSTENTRTNAVLIGIRYNIARPRMLF
ncbi:MAG: hypothetical protein K9H61_03000 [Bacteroidia bacterium]|nr:hypothetical protein [Bacteroidia bacterium]MCF8445940.1 hypothetical protein [Bacteroidia bacterium]